MFLLTHLDLAILSAFNPHCQSSISTIAHELQSINFSNVGPTMHSNSNSSRSIF